MKEKSRSNLLLVEIIIAVFFFMLSATVLVRVFGTARAQTIRAGIESAALGEAQSLADLIYAAADPDQALAEADYDSGHGVWTKSFGDFTLHAALEEEPYRSGTLRSASITAFYQQDSELFTLPVERYLPGEVD